MPKELSSRAASALAQGFIGALIDNDVFQLNERCVEDMLEAIRDQLEPDDVFEEEDLGAWAEANGFKREEKED